MSFDGTARDAGVQLERLAAASASNRRKALTMGIIEIERHAKRIARSGGVFSDRSKGRLAASLGHAVVSDDEAQLDVGVVYGAIQDHGGVTRPHEIRARDVAFHSTFSWRGGKTVARKERGKTGGVLAFNVGGVTVFAKSVRHPGSRIRAKNYSQKSYEAAKDFIERTIDKALLGELAR